MNVTSKVVNKSTVTIVLEHDEAQWLRDIISRVVYAHTPSTKLFNLLNNIPGIKSNLGCEGHGFTGEVIFKEPT